jgi:hypothetical protein
MQQIRLSCSWAGNHATGHAVMQLGRQPCSWACNHAAKQAVKAGYHTAGQAVMQLGSQSCSWSGSHTAGQAVMQLGRQSCDVAFLLKVSVVKTMSIISSSQSKDTKLLIYWLSVCHKLM